MVEGKIIAYDLPSENMTVYNQRNELKDKARLNFLLERLQALGFSFWLYHVLLLCLV
jgi:hypothetical protein